jgi:tRNA dimethylallyltransferase
VARVIAIVGATATGKTALAEALAEALGAEIVCADSRQVFRELEVGTGKPDPGERAIRPHHLFDALALGDRASAGWYARACAEVRDAVRSRARLPLLVGGSGLYLRAAERGLAQEPPLDAAVRERLRAETRGIRSEELHARLAARDPTTAARLAPGDRQRVSRALEVLEASGKPLSWWHARGPAPARRESWKVLELVVDSDELRARVAHRTRWMMEHGLVEETRALVEAGHGEALRALRAVGYDEVLALLAGELERDDAEARINQRTAQLAKRQRTWFRHQIQATRLEVSGLGEKRLLERALEHLGAAR